MSRILISGGDGRFCKELVKYGLQHDIKSPTRREMDITNLNQIEDWISRYEPDFFIHAAALTRPMVVHEVKPSKSITTNIIGTSNVVLACMKYNVKLIYISTDYVYPGTDGNYSEEDSLKPMNKYAWSKLGGECAVQIYHNHLILRVAMNENPFPHPKACVDMKKSLIYIDEAAKLTLELLNENGIINIGGKPQSVYDFVRETNPDIGEISLSEINDVGMAEDSTMNINKLKGIIGDTVI